MAGVLAAAGGASGPGATAATAAATQAGQYFASPRTGKSAQRLDAYAPDQPQVEGMPPMGNGISDLIGTQRAMRTPAPLNIMDLLQQNMQ